MSSGMIDMNKAKEDGKAIAMALQSSMEKTIKMQATGNRDAVQIAFGYNIGCLMHLASCHMNITANKNPSKDPSHADFTELIKCTMAEFGDICQDMWDSHYNGAENSFKTSQTLIDKRGEK